jgi:hypothetical protein
MSFILFHAILLSILYMNFASPKILPRKSWRSAIFLKHTGNFLILTEPEHKIPRDPLFFSISAKVPGYSIMEEQVKTFALPGDSPTFKIISPPF